MKKFFCGLLTIIVLLFSLSLMGCSDPSLETGTYTYENTKAEYSYEVKTSSLYIYSFNEGYIVLEYVGGDLKIYHFKYKILEENKYIAITDADDEYPTTEVIKYEHNNNSITLGTYRYEKVDAV